MDDKTMCAWLVCGSENVVDDTILYHMVILSGGCVNKWLVCVVV